MIKNKINRKQDEIRKGPFHIVKFEARFVIIKKGMVIDKVNKRNIQRLRGGEDFETKNYSTRFFKNFKKLPLVMDNTFKFSEKDILRGI